MPTATPFTALGRGNGFASFCTIPISEATSSPTWESYDLCPEEFTLEEVMDWAWNGHDYTGTSLSIEEDIYATTYTRYRKWYLNYSEANQAWGGDLPDGGQGLNLGARLENGAVIYSSGRNTQPYERVCRARPSLRFFETESDDTGIISSFTRFIRIRIVYDSNNNNYRFLVLAGGGRIANESKIVADGLTVENTITFEIPITSSKHISVPMASSEDELYSEYIFTSAVKGQIDFYTY
jgi:hypothetical protein